ncbi:MAG: cytochrome c oxidase subunit 3 [Bernardetiaceae bacterium]
MATATVQQTIPQAPTDLWKGGEEPLKSSYGKLMMWFFLVSDAFTFSAFLVAYGVARFREQIYEGTMADFQFSADYWPIPEMVYAAVPFLHGVHLPLVFVGIMTFILILSSVTMVLAVEAGHRNSQAEVEKWMLWTIVGGITFLGCQAWEWSHFIAGDPESAYGAAGSFIGANLIQNQYGPALFADFFFFITGFHGMHVFSGVVLNVLVYYNTVMGVYDRKKNYEMVEKVGLYWHFVDLVWVFVFTFFYLV